MRNEKKIIVLVWLAILAVVFSVTALAHPGKTDAYGGHTDSSTGVYHYHHGYSAHQHPGGVCPYDNKVGNSSGSSGNGGYNGGSWNGGSGNSGSSGSGGGSGSSGNSWNNDTTEYNRSSILIAVAVILAIIFSVSFFAFDAWEEPESFFDYFFRYKYDGIVYKVFKTLFILPTLVIALACIIGQGAYELLVKRIASKLFDFAEDKNVVIKLLFVPLGYIVAILGFIVSYLSGAISLFWLLYERVISFLESLGWVGEEI